jgi:hypothetical protein
MQTRSLVTLLLRRFGVAFQLSIFDVVHAPVIGKSNYFCVPIRGPNLGLRIRSERGGCKGKLYIHTVCTRIYMYRLILKLRAWRTYFSTFHTKILQQLGSATHAGRQ